MEQDNHRNQKTNRKKLVNLDHREFKPSFCSSFLSSSLVVVLPSLVVSSIASLPAGVSTALFFPLSSFDGCSSSFVILSNLFDVVCVKLLNGTRDQRCELGGDGEMYNVR